MSAREELIEIVTRDPISSGGDEIWATDLVDAFAHELAEKIRQEIQSLKDHEVLEPDKDWAASTAADFIDPYVN